MSEITIYEPFMVGTSNFYVTCAIFVSYELFSFIWTGKKTSYSFFVFIWAKNITSELFWLIINQKQKYYIFCVFTWAKHVTCELFPGHITQNVSYNTKYVSLLVCIGQQSVVRTILLLYEPFYTLVCHTFPSYGERVGHVSPPWTKNMEMIIFSPASALLPLFPNHHGCPHAISALAILHHVVLIVSCRVVSFRVLLCLVLSCLD